MEAPPVDVVRVRSRLWCHGVAMLAVIGYLVADIALYYVFERRMDHDALRWGTQLLPWAVGLPFLRRASMSRSAWLVLSLAYPVVFLLVGRLTFRLMMLPARDWEPAYWELDRVSPIPGKSPFWVLAPEPGTPAGIRLAPPADSSVWRRFKWASRRAWVIVFPAFAVTALIGINESPLWLSLPAALGMALVAIAPVFAVNAAHLTRAQAPAVSV